PNPRYQVQPGNEILEPLAFIENGARSEAAKAGLCAYASRRDSWKHSLAALDSPQARRGKHLPLSACGEGVGG
uniref:hypothetical protein n=1 Tax=Scytonema sp. HK-05 TaxID=1137095 RepID=UPI00095DE2FF